MHKPMSALAALALAAAVTLPAPAMAQSHDRTKVGTLTCDISAGLGFIITSKKHLTCMYTPSQPGPREVYTGSITKFGRYSRLVISASVRLPVTTAALPPRRPLARASAPMYWLAARTVPSPCNHFRYRIRPVSIWRSASQDSICTRRARFVSAERPY